MGHGAPTAIGRSYGFDGVSSDDANDPASIRLPSASSSQRLEALRLLEARRANNRLLKELVAVGEQALSMSRRRRAALEDEELLLQELASGGGRGRAVTEVLRLQRSDGGSQSVERPPLAAARDAMASPPTGMSRSHVAEKIELLKRELELMDEEAAAHARRRSAANRASDVLLETNDLLRRRAQAGMRRNATLAVMR